MTELENALEYVTNTVVDFVRWLNDPDTVRPVVEVGVWATTLFFTLFFFIMLALRPRNRVDVGWTWLVGSCSLIMLRVVTLYYTEIRFEPVVTLFIWGNMTLAIVYTCYVYVDYKWHKWRTWRAVKSGHDRRSGIDRRKENRNAN